VLITDWGATVGLHCGCIACGMGACSGRHCADSASLRSGVGSH